MSKEKTENTETLNVSYVKKMGTQDLSQLNHGESVKVGGTCKGIETGTSTYGEFTRFLGNFEMQGESIHLRSGKLFLPDVGSDLVKNAFEEQVKSGVENPEVTFAMEIVKEKTTPKAKGDRDYIWRVRPLVAEKTPSPLQIAMNAAK